MTIFRTSQMVMPSPRLRTSQVLNRAPTEPERREMPVLWPRWIGGKVAMIPIPADRIPPGWQSVRIRVPQRLATCEEVDCPMFLRGWTEVRTGSGEMQPRVGDVKPDEAAGMYGYFGAASLPPETIPHPAGTPCPRVHKLPSGVPPLYLINGRTTTWNEFEDALGGGIHRMDRIAQEGRY